MSRKKPVLAVDFDDMVFDFNDIFRAYNAKHYGRAYEFDSIHTYNLAEILGCAEDEKNRRVMEFYHSREHAEGWAIPGALEALAMLSQVYDLHMVSARPSSVEAVTVEWLHRRGADLHFSGKHFTGAYHPNYGWGKTIAKADVCLSIGAVALAEDALHHAKDVSLAGVPVYMLDKPWNKSSPLAGVTRVHGWEEILRHLGAHESAPAA